MGTVHTTTLKDRAVLVVAGADARGFLQGLVTADMTKVGISAAAFGGLLTPQGKVLFDFHIAERADGEFLLDTAQSLAADLAKRLTFYRLRAKVSVGIAGDLAVAVCWDAPPSPTPGLTWCKDPRTAAMGWRAIGTPAAIASAAGHWQQSDPGDYHKHRIGEGVPECGADYLSGEVFPHEALFDRQHGVDFEKGCYVGQEVVSRMQHRGTARSRFLTVTAATELPVRGTAIMAGGTPLGALGGHAGTRGLALLRIDRLRDALAAGEQPRAGDVAIAVDADQLAGFAAQKAHTP